eukprot:scaffold163063_cov31-Tisochrysis_lutea.AAC.3
MTGIESCRAGHGNRGSRGARLRLGAEPASEGAGEGRSWVARWEHMHEQCLLRPATDGCHRRACMMMLKKTTAAMTIILTGTSAALHRASKEAARVMASKATVHANRGEQSPRVDRRSPVPIRVQARCARA